MAHEFQTRVEACRQATELLATGLQIRKAAARVGIPQGTLERWLRAWKSGGAEAMASDYSGVGRKPVAAPVRSGRIVVEVDDLDVVAKRGADGLVVADPVVGVDDAVPGAVQLLEPQIVFPAEILSGRIARCLERCGHGSAVVAADEAVGVVVGRAFVGQLDAEQEEEEGQAAGADVFTVRRSRHPSRWKDFSYDSSYVHFFSIESNGGLDGEIDLFNVEASEFLSQHVENIVFGNPVVAPRVHVHKEAFR